MTESITLYKYMKSVANMVEKQYEKHMLITLFYG